MLLCQLCAYVYTTSGMTSSNLPVSSHCVKKNNNMKHHQHLRMVSVFNPYIGGIGIIGGLLGLITITISTIVYRIDTGTRFRPGLTVLSDLGLDAAGLVFTPGMVITTMLFVVYAAYFASTVVSMCTPQTEIKHQHQICLPNECGLAMLSFASSVMCACGIVITLCFRDYHAPGALIPHMIGAACAIGGGTLAVVGATILTHTTLRVISIIQCVMSMLVVLSTMLIGVAAFVNFLMVVDVGFATAAPWFPASEMLYIVAQCSWLIVTATTVIVSGVAVVKKKT